MSAFSQTAEWFLARDGQQFGPVSGVEFHKLVELGHLKPSDMVWSDGMPAWQPAGDVVARLLAQSNAEAAVEAMPLQAPSEPSGRNINADASQSALAGHDTHHEDVPPDYHQQLAVEQMAAPHATDAQRDPRPRPRTIAPEPDLSARREPAPTGASHALSVDRDTRPEHRQTRRTRRSEAGHPRSNSDVDERARPSTLATIGRWAKRIAVLVFFASTLSAAAWYAWPHREKIMSVASAVTGGAGTMATSPLAGFSPSPEASDQALQKLMLWRVIKRDFPDWYGARVKEGAELSRTQKPDTEIAQYVAESLAKLRRQYAGDALSATPAQLFIVATSFAESLTRLRRHSVDACYTFISAGEANPTIVPLMQTSDIAGPLQKQMLAVFNAVAEGRKTPRVYPPPKQSDYDILVKELQTRGWTQGDMKLFSDSGALAKAPPDKVCTMVMQWFESQIAIKDPDAQLRLLVDSLRPVVAG
jgi:hypothetical protein